MQETTVTNQMLYDLLKEFKRDVHKRFEQLEENQHEDRKLLMGLWENRTKTTLNFSSAYFLITLTCSILAAMATASIIR